MDALSVFCWPTNPALPDRRWAYCSWDATTAPRPTLLHEHTGHVDWVRWQLGFESVYSRC